MSHTVSGKITRAPKIQQGQNSNGQYTAFFFEVSEFIKGYGETQDSYTNYSVALFPKTPGAIEFHTKAIQEGAFVVVSCEKLKIDVSNIEYPKLKMDNARLENFFNPNQQAPQQAQGGYQQQAPQQQAPQQNNQSWGNAPQQQQAAPQQQQAQMAPAYQPAPQQSPQQAPAPQQQQAPKAPAQYNEPSMDFDDDIPF